MRLRHTILGLLSQKPASGYDLKRTIMDAEIFPWSGNNNQIYKCLIELQNEGMLTSQTQVQTGLPNKKIYTISAQGLAELSTALREPPEPPEIQKDILMRLAFADQLADEEIIRLLETYEHEIQVRLKMLSAQSAQSWILLEESARSAYFRKRIADNLAGAHLAEIEWLHQTIKELNENRAKSQNKKGKTA